MAFYSERLIPVFPAFSPQPEWRGLMINTYFAPSTPGTAESEGEGEGEGSTVSRSVALHQLC